MPVRRGRRRPRSAPLLYLLAGTVGAFVTTWYVTGFPPWASSATGSIGWWTFIGVWTVAFGGFLGIGIAAYLSHVFLGELTCPRCRARNNRGTEVCEVCDLPLHHFASAFWPDVTAPSPGR